MPSWAKTLRRLNFQRIIASLTLACLVVCAVGFPLPSVINATKQAENSEPYPCMDCPCGCKDAETCWRDCCCHTHQEKLAWARRNSVTPPAYVLALAESETLKKKPACCQKRACCEQKNCCQKPQVASACCTNRAQKSCCSGKAPGPQRTKSLGKQGVTQPATLIVMQALRCQGIYYSLTMLPPSVVPSNALQFCDMPMTGNSIVRTDALVDNPTDLPETPPPEFCT